VSLGVPATHSPLLDTAPCRRRVEVGAQAFPITILLRLTPFVTDVPVRK
jgi:hypothetical protein